jgi:hypothetical protein
VSFKDLETIAELFEEAQERHERSIRADVIRSGGVWDRQGMTSGREERPCVSAAALLRAVLASMRVPRRGFVGTWLQAEAMRLARRRAIARWDPGDLRSPLSSA